MSPGFQSLYVKAICDQDGRNWKLLEDVQYISRDGRKFIIPRGASTDGASTPSVVWMQLPPTGPYWLAAVLHDSAYQNTLEIGGQKAALEKPACDDLLKEAMELTGVDTVTADVIYEAVKLFGAPSFKSDRS